MSIIQKLDQGYLSANYPRPNNAFIRFTEHSEEAVWVLERRPNIVKKSNGLLKRWFGKAQRVIESDVTIPNNDIVSYGGQH